MTETQTPRQCDRRDVHEPHVFERLDDDTLSTFTEYRCSGRTTVAPPPRHDYPLLPGEVRSHTVGRTTFTVMHAMGGSFVQATASALGEASRVLHTSASETAALRAYREAVEQAESDAVDALDDADDVQHFAADGSLVTGLGDTATVRPQDGTPDAAAQALAYNLPDGADPLLVTGEHDDAMPSLRALVESYGEAIARAALYLTYGDRKRVLQQADRAEAVKTEIVTRFGGPR